MKWTAQRLLLTENVVGHASIQRTTLHTVPPFQKLNVASGTIISAVDEILSRDLRGDLV